MSKSPVGWSDAYQSSSSGWYIITQVRAQVIEDDHLNEIDYFNYII